MKDIYNFFANLKDTLPTISIMDVVDILLVALLIYAVINLIRTTSAYRIARSIVLLLLVTLVTDILNLHTLNYLLNRVLQLGFVALVIVFQPELRRLLERLGGKSVQELIGKSGGSPVDECVRQVVAACTTMSEERVGALIAFERANSLEQICATGTRIDGAVSQELIRNIFFPKAALHDGAMVIRENRVEAAGCVLPLSENRKLSSDLGTRHRAGVGLSETADAVVIIVSEETGTVSVAIHGMLKRHLAPETLQKLLLQELGGNERKASVLDRIRNRKGDGKDDEKA